MSPLPSRPVVLTLLLVVCGAARVANGCSIPVFRYALENWPADPYLLRVVTGDSGLTDELQRQIDALPLRSPDGRALINLSLKQELAGVAAENAVQPTFVLERLIEGSPDAAIWSGELSADVLGRVMDSPLRTTIANQLLQGESIVWVLLEGGRPDQDAAVFELLDRELARLEQALQLPDIDPADAAELSIEPESLRLSFALHRLSRTAPEEELLRELLLSVEPDLKDEEYNGEPMAFPIFGRGCALYALIGDGINPSTIEEASRFLVGGCQCTVKRMNPGIDLLLKADWDACVQPTLPRESVTPPLAGLGGFAPLTAVAPKLPTRDPQSTTNRDVPTSPQEATLSPQDPHAIPVTATSSAPAMSQPAPVDHAALSRRWVLALTGISVLTMLCIALRRS